jgi:hypothetical protein
VEHCCKSGLFFTGYGWIITLKNPDPSIDLTLGKFESDYGSNLKGIVSRDWGGLLMILMDRFNPNPHGWVIKRSTFFKRKINA